MIKLINIKKYYKNNGLVTKAVSDVSFNIKKGEFVSIMGPSGSGKSTLMHILGFLDTLTHGQYYFKEKNVSELSNNELAELRNKEAGFIFQTYNLLPKTSVYENIRLPLIYSDLTENERKTKILKTIESVKLTHRTNYLSNQLSGGEQQRVAIARAIVNNPSIIFADEPTGNLDSKTGQTIMQILQELNNEGRTIILVTHEKDTAMHAKRIIKIKDGKLIKDELVINQKIAKNHELEK